MQGLKNPKILLYNLISFILAAGLFISGQSILAWDDPASVPPTGNVDEPINQGATNQTKQAGLILNSGAIDTNGLIVQSGKVGIGTLAPNKDLHIYQISGDNAEIDIQSVAGANNHWAIYHDRATNELRVWKTSNLLIINQSGQLGIGISPSAQLDVNGKIKMRTETSATDTDNTVATKGYVDDKLGEDGIKVYEVSDGCSNVGALSNWPNCGTATCYDPGGTYSYYNCSGTCASYISIFCANTLVGYLMPK